jgi:hypothetical protein
MPGTSRVAVQIPDHHQMKMIRIRALIAALAAVAFRLT